MVPSSLFQSLQMEKSMFTVNVGKGGAGGSLNGFKFCFKHVKQSLIIFWTVFHPLGSQNR